MKKARYDAIRIAKELRYNENTISKIKEQHLKAKSHGFCMMQGRRWNDAKSNYVPCLQRS